MNTGKTNNMSGAFDRNLEFRGLCESQNISIAEALRYLKAEAVAGRIDLKPAIGNYPITKVKK